MDIHSEIELQDCPYCRGAGLLEEENGWCWYVMCMECGSQTAPIPYKTPQERLEAARSAAQLWNIGKVLRADIGE
ncbi:MAG: Lar family restriction alleviation protein [Oscillospiraceae bacterium]|nr:Lar family restriction alleviation protein [Oscillospiraceae bacterium]MBQ1619862.1 Lar family restriction alleviation protein [Oscillospiraceae bacterium]MBQ1741808.1 Lar family restriction alleviation protein [Oscillospiraceae bacterium]MBQ1804643.1 Lar family restriction alleviation protein [Oscillospiraceae bacterium]MBQ1805967.1 Lar family restriction alleviation protein [Oscillospiraceae bacterium]